VTSNPGNRNDTKLWVIKSAIKNLKPKLQSFQKKTQVILVDGINLFSRQFSSWKGNKPVWKGLYKTKLARFVKEQINF
jgi:hypothetical protein